MVGVAVRVAVAVRVGVRVDAGAVCWAGTIVTDCADITPPPVSDAVYAGAPAIAATSPNAMENPSLKEGALTRWLMPEGEDMCGAVDPWEAKKRSWTSLL
jgi:hypothetical protein